MIKLNNIKNYSTQHKGIIIAFVLFICMTPILFFVAKSVTPVKAPTITSSKTPLPTALPTNSISHRINNEGFPDLQKEEVLPNGGYKRYLDSANPARSNIIQSGPDGSILFERYIVGPDASERLSDNSISYGTPEHIFSGSRFYGPSAQTYLFATKGVALIANPQTDQVLEKHFFPPMSVDAYVQKYGEDIVTK